MTGVLSFPLSLFVSMALVPFLMRYAGTLGLVDKPDGVRKIHSKIIPKSGGLAIAIAVFVSVIYNFEFIAELIPLMIGSLVIVIFGYLDDRFDLHYKWKFLGQIIAILVFMLGTPQLFDSSAVGLTQTLFSYVVIFLFLLGTSNAINLSDGLDGLAAGVTFLSLGLIGFIAFESEIIGVMLVALATMGALMGFLRYNTHPAKVFMGDTGSQFIGFTSAGLAVYLAQSSASAINPILPLLILGLPIMDTLMVMVVRIYSGKSPFYPDKNHIHHQLMKFGFYHYEAVAILYVLQIFLVSIGGIIRFDDAINLIGFYLFFVMGCLGFLYLANSRQWKFRSIEKPIDFIERRNPVFRKLNWVYEHNAVIILITIGVMWLFVGVLSIQQHASIRPLALILLIVSFVVGIIFPKRISFSTRMVTYSSTVLGLYAFSTASDINHYSIFINFLLFILVVFIALAIRLTRKEMFTLNNQDLIILFLLLISPLLPLAGDDGVRIGEMLFRIMVTIYAIEYLISRSPAKMFWLRLTASASLFILIFI
jgi:UDP-GlcNAc:undecaprenyl-phosphate/decaprenyl-phosphate GlcNAc-1-phosphate transferase